MIAPPHFSIARSRLSAYPKRGCASPQRFSPKLVLTAAAALLTWILVGSAGRELAQANARAAGVEGRVDFRVQNVLAADVSKATVVTLFLLSSSNERLRPMLTQQLKPGARIVSHAFSMGRDWPADAIDQFVSARGDEVTLYLWRIK